jgi:proteasome assembly chaperone (PAC2) family protein
MSSRIDALEARRQALLNKCEDQRLELAYRVSQITPKAALTAWSRRSGKSAGKNPLAWIAGVVGLLLMLRRRRRSVSGIGGIGLVTGLLALATRATTILRVLAQLRAIYLSYKATRRPTDR